MFDFLNRAKAETLADNIETDQNAEQEARKLLAFIKAQAPSEPADDACESILEKITAGRPNAGAHKQRRRAALNLRRAVVAMGLATVLSMAWLLIGISRTPSDNFIIKQALAAVDKTGKITYYKVTGYVTWFVGTEKRGRERTTEYFWIDNERGIVRSSSTFLLGPKPQTRYEISDGKRKVVFDGSRQQHATESRSRPNIPSSLTDIKAQAKNYRLMLSEGRARIVGEENTHGVAAYIVRNTRVPWEDGDFKIIMTVTARIRKDNYEPLSMTIRTTFPGQHDSEIEDHRDLFVFDEVEMIDPATLPPDFFSMAVPKEVDYAVSENYSLDELKNFKGFGLYYVGDTFEGGALSPISYYVKDIRRNHVPRKYREKRHEVGLTYQDNALEGSFGLDIVNMPADHPRAKKPLAEPGETSEAIDVDGAPAILIKTPAQRSFKKAFNIDFTYTLTLQKGNSAVFITTDDKNRLLRAARALVKLN